MEKIRLWLALFAAAAVPLIYYMTQRQQSAGGRLHDWGETARDRASDAGASARDTAGSWAGTARETLGSLAESGRETLGSLAGSSRDTLGSAGEATRERAGTVALAVGSVAGKARPVLAATPRVVSRLRRSDDQDNPYAGSGDWRKYGDTFDN